MGCEVGCEVGCEKVVKGCGGVVRWVVGRL